jgi:D-sedoheptulose 7-phosphate isomerase|tara:strand:- start:823 stop:1398 length:576 start_codon:yes stop_codon:yes gene_type:complete
MLKKIKQSIKESIVLKKKIERFSKEITNSVNLVANTLANEGRIFLCGNGGSAADAQHLAAEYLIRLKKNVKRKAFPALSLAMDTSTLTACGNDLGFNKIFSRNLEALGKKNDLLIVLSTSGNSTNVLEALKLSKKMNLKSIALLGSKGGKMKRLADEEIIIPSNNVARIQESHIFLGHLIFELAEKIVIKK